MPISGVVITTQPEEQGAACGFLENIAGVEVHGADGQGNIVAVFETPTVESMELIMKQVNASPLILHAGITYINMEDVQSSDCGEQG